MTTITLPCDATHGTGAYDAGRAEPLGAQRARLRDEFLSMPALCLTVPQVARLVGLSIAGTTDLLTDLEDEGFLMRTPRGMYRLAQPLLS